MLIFIVSFNIFILCIASSPWAVTLSWQQASKARKQAAGPRAVCLSALVNTQTHRQLLTAIGLTS